MITLHTIVKNEEKFVKEALLAALSSNEVKRALVWDTGSTDKTVEKILSIKDRRIEFRQRGNIDRKTLVLLRKEQLEMTKTPWFLLVDGDEIWPERNLQKLILAIKQCNNETIALVNRTRNAVGDLYHYLPESEGHYQIGRWSGHLNIRAVRNLAGLTVKGEYPNEWYEYPGKKIQSQPERLEFVDTWYLHTTHLKRSGNWISEIKTLDRLKKHKWLGKFRKENLLVMKESELPKLLRTKCQ
jgi:glycosyltransferase involved in cell wall biosynthesis